MTSSDERKFIHDLAGPLAAALLLVGSMIEDARGASGAPAAQSACLESLVQILEKLQKLLEARRKAIIDDSLEDR